MASQPSGAGRAADEDPRGDAGRVADLAAAVEAMAAARTVAGAAACLAGPGRTALGAETLELALASLGGQLEPVGSPDGQPGTPGGVDVEAVRAFRDGKAIWSERTGWLPLLARGRAVGVVTATWPEGSAPTTEQRIAALALAQPCAAAIERARQHEQDGHVEAAAEAERRRALAVLSSVTDAFFAADRHWRFTYLNREAARLLGRTVDELLGRPLWEEATGLASGLFGDQLRWATEHGVSVAFEYRHEHARRWFDVRGYPTAEGIAVYLRDATARKHAEEELRASEERFRLLVDGARDHALYLLDPEGRVESWNVGAERLTGYPARDVLGRHFSLFFAPEDVHAGVPDELLRRAAEEGRTQSEGWRLRKGGERFWAQRTLSALRDDQGRLRGFANVSSDLTARKRAEEERDALFAREREARRLFEAVLRAATEYSVVGTDQHGTITVFNEGAERMLGYRAAEVVGRLTPLMFHDAAEVARRAADLNVPPGFDVFVAVPRHGEAEAREWTYVRKDGSRLCVWLTVTAMREESGDLAGFIGIARDLGEERRLGDSAAPATPVASRRDGAAAD